MKNIKDYNLDELKNELESLGEKGFRAEQIFKWLYVEKVKEFEELAKPLMEYLHKNFHPHAQIIINWDGAEVVEGKIGVPYAERS